MKRYREKVLIVGLGNPGKEYEKTRHNLGQQVLFAFAQKRSLSFKKERDVQGQVAIGNWENTKLILLFPATYMNLSGKAVRQMMHFYKIALEDILILLDDADLPFGALRFRKSGSSGGHNGLRSIEESLKTLTYQRLKLGIGRTENGSLKDHVLSPFTEEEQEKIPEIAAQALGAIEGWLLEEI